MADQNHVNPKKVAELNEEIYQNGAVDRVHLMEFLTCIETNDAQAIVEAVENWLQDLHSDPRFSKVIFPNGDIDAVIGDLDSYGRVQPDTIQNFKQQGSRTLPIS